MLKQTLLAAVLTISGSLTAQAAPVIWDYSPDATGISSGGNSYTNIATGQNFLERVTFGSDTTVSGMSIYMTTFFGNVGDSVTIKLFSDGGAAPGTLLSSFNETVSEVDAEGTTIRPAAHRVFAEFTNNLNLLAGSYYIGMSGAGITMTQSSLSGGPDDGRMWQLNSDSVSFLANVGDMAFRLYGASDPVPAPGALALLGLGLIGFGLRKRAA